MCYEIRRAEACGTRKEPGTLTQGAPVFPGSSRLGIEPKTPEWLVQDPTTSPSGDLIPTIRGSGAHPGGAGTREEPGTLTQGGALFSLVPLVWESTPKLQGGWCKSCQGLQGDHPPHN